MGRTGMNMGVVKLQNRSLVLNYINGNAPVSRKDVADATGLTPAAVTQICNALISEGLLTELGTAEESSGAGRKKVLVDINYNYAYLFSVNIEPEQTYIALSNLKGDFLATRTIDTLKDVASEVFLAKVADICEDIRENAKERVRKRILAISVGITGIVNRETGTSVRAYGIWKDEVPVCDILSKALGLDAFIENNVNAFAKAVMLYGVGRFYDNLHIIKWGPGVGSTIIIDGRVYEGRHGKAAELGHFIVEKDGKECSCGRRGCLETKVNYKALNEIVKFDKDSFGEAYINASDEQKKKIEEAIDLFARTIINSSTIMAPNRVVLCGYLFHDDVIRDILIKDCKMYDSAFDENRIIYTTLADSEDFIGPVAAFVQSEIF